MLKRLAYLIAGSALLLLVAAMFWGFNRLNALTLAQQQTQRQITQWRDQPQHNNDYHELQAAVKNITGRTETLTRQLNDAASAQAEQLQSINEQIKALERQVQTLSTSYQHLQQQTATRSRAKAKAPSHLRFGPQRPLFLLSAASFAPGGSSPSLPHPDIARSHSFSLWPPATACRAGNCCNWTAVTRLSVKAGSG